MDDLLEALEIFRKYQNKDYPTHCEHDELFIVGYGTGSTFPPINNAVLEKGSYMLIYEYGYLKGYSRGLDSTFLWKKDSINFENNFIEKK